MKWEIYERIVDWTEEVTEEGFLNYKCNESIQDKPVATIELDKATLKFYNTSENIKQMLYSILTSTQETMVHDMTKTKEGTPVFSTSVRTFIPVEDPHDLVFFLNKMNYYVKPVEEKIKVN